MKLGTGLCAAVMVLALSVGAQARVVDLESAPRIAHVDGQAANDHAGLAVAAAGDVNGDGKPDLVVGAPSADNNGRASSGSAYVLYGGRIPANLDLQQLGAAGFRIDGSKAGVNAGLALAAAGDLNGDGIDDLTVGAPFASESHPASGSLYVLYGRRTADLADLDLATITPAPSERGLRIDGAGEGNDFGLAAAAAGDVNGDGRPDVLVAAPFASNNGRDVSGSAYVLFGGNGLAGIDLDALGNKGFRIDAAEEDDHLGLAAAGTGDFNGDGLDDVVLGSIHSGADVGAAYVVYGQSSPVPANVDLAGITTTQAQRGMLIAGAAAGDLAGFAVSGGGDLNGDGRADAVVGAPHAAEAKGSDAQGAAYVLYGEGAADPGDVDLAAIAGAQATRGMRIAGASGGDEAGSALAVAGDLSGDGIADLLVGAPTAESHGRAESGSAFLVDGAATADPADLDLGQVSTPEAPGGARIEGAAMLDRAGASLAAVGDLDGDGHPEAILGSPGASGNARTGSGSVDVLDLGGPDTALDSVPSLTNDPTPTFAFHASEPASFRCSTDSGSASFAPCSGPGGSHTAAAPLADGTYTFRVAAVDAFGNLDPTPAAAQFTVDTQPPDTMLTKHPRKLLSSAKGSRRARARFAFRASEPGATFSCRLDKRRPRPCRSPRVYRLKRGRHTFSVLASDRAGNRDPTPARFKLKVTPPKQHHKRHR